jgi:hypothetical protein
MYCTLANIKMGELEVQSAMSAATNLLRLFYSVQRLYHFSRMTQIGWDS